MQATCKEASVHDEKGVTATELSTAAQPKPTERMSIRKSNMKASKAPKSHTCNELSCRLGAVSAIDRLPGRCLRYVGHHSNSLHILYMKLRMTADEAKSKCGGH